MIANLTSSEWDALQAAVVLAETIWDQDGEPEERRRLAPLSRAYRKAMQLAPRRAA